MAYPTRDMDLDTKLMTMRGNNVHFSRIVVPHELIPGHHLQGYMAARSRTHREACSRRPSSARAGRSTGSCGCGTWASPRGPEDRIGMLFWRMHRARAHHLLAEVPPRADAAAGDDRLPGRARGPREGRRDERGAALVGGGYGPLYQCAYMIGGLQLRALHDELVGGARCGPGAGRMSEAVPRRGAEQNCIRVELIRAALTQAPLHGTASSPGDCGARCG